jgi:hypothetical protein
MSQLRARPTLSCIKRLRLLKSLIGRLTRRNPFQLGGHLVPEGWEHFLMAVDAAHCTKMISRVPDS